MCLITVEWMCFGYSLAFTEGNAVYGGSSRFWLGMYVKDEVGA